MSETDISAERRIATGMGCEIAAWDATALVVHYHRDDQRLQLINALASLGWSHPVDDPGDADAMLLDIRREPANKKYPAPLVMESPRAGQIALAGFTCAMIAIGVHDVHRDIVRHAPWLAIIASITYILILAFVLYSGLQYFTLKVWLTPQEIILANFFKKRNLSISAIKSCAVEMYHTFGMPFYTFIFVMKDGRVHKMPAPFKGFHNFKDEISKRYSFSVYP